MTRCPYCRTVANPLRLLVYSGLMGYRCAKCGGRSMLTKWGWAPMIGVLLVTVVFGDLIVPIRVLWVAVGAVAALLIMWLFLRLHVAEGGEPPDPNA